MLPRPVSSSGHFPGGSLRGVQMEPVPENAPIHSSLTRLIDTG
jgi:hypothetical protein